MTGLDWLSRESFALEMGISERTLRRHLSDLGLDTSDHQLNHPGQPAMISPHAAGQIRRKRGRGFESAGQLERELESYATETRALQAEVERLKAENRELRDQAVIKAQSAELEAAREEIDRLKESGAAMARALYNIT